MAYFKTVDYGGGVFAIWETLGVGSFLIVGGDKALLIDTGFGFGDISAEVRRLTDKPLVVVNSHVHPDHSMSNDLFERVAVGAGDMGKLQGGELWREFDMALGFTTRMLPPIKLLFSHYKRLPRPSPMNTRYDAIESGDTFDLSGRVIEAVAMPGHTKGSVVFLDRTSRMIFVGDAVNRGMFLFTNKDARLGDYAKRLDDLASLSGFDWILGSHSKKRIPFAFVRYYADFLRRADPAKSKPHAMPLADAKALRYMEKSRDFGTVSVFYNQDQV